MIELKYEGYIVPKARPRVGKKRTVYKPEYVECKNDLIVSFRQQLPFNFAPIQKCWIAINLSGDHARNGDNDNITGTILDSLADAHVIHNDNLSVIEDVYCSYENINADPTAEILIFPESAVGEVLTKDALEHRIKAIEQSVAFTLDRQGTTHEKVMTLFLGNPYEYGVSQKYRLSVKNQQGKCKYLQRWYCHLITDDFDCAIKTYNDIDSSKPLSR